MHVHKFMHVCVCVYARALMYVCACVYTHASEAINVVYVDLE